MPSPKHKCAQSDCDKMIAAKSTHCRNHVPRTLEWINKQASSQTGRTLSQATRQKISKAHAGKVETICQWCGNAFLIKPCRLEDGHGKYCSNKCNYAARAGENSRYWNGGKTQLTCAQCGIVFDGYECSHKGKLIFCSFSCKGIYQKSRQTTTNTNIEQVMRKSLTEARFTFQEQVALHNTSVADFFLPQDNIAIFCDGDYWHSLPERQKRDKRQTGVLQAHGVKVLRFWERDILSNIGHCLSIIQQARQSPLEDLDFYQLGLPTFE